MKRIGFLLVAVWISLAFSCQKNAQQTTIILGHSLPTAHPVHNAIMYFADQAFANSDGKLQIKVYPNSQLGSEREVLELVQIGSVGMTKVSAGTMANFSPKYRVLGVPYLFRGEEHAWDVLEGEIGREILDSGQEYLLNGLVFYDAGSRSFYTKDVPIRTAEDVKGLKLRVMNDQMAIEMVNLLGGSATPMSFGELYTALQQGVVDGAENNAPSVVSSNHYEVCNYYTLDRHTMLPDVLVVGMTVWEKLDDKEKSWLMEAAKASLVEEKKLWRKAVESDMKFLREQGMEIIEPDADSFREATKPMKDRLRANPVLGDLLDRIENLNKS
ncbi:TRAP transporter substrate-binding protein [Membranicola marinus]|uniref:TRAP transporter substrate-binding protein n=1 Tax=Membranihabitans marinus TaxID=1227546 RepID=A0A953HV30_9BACT|nr:TRAP transporter substrate-binding protein [Membranihabitans marinus]MBY5958825.1 TRAP transporter substrate-binding protein [Membranihabitans marinus]